MSLHSVTSIPFHARLYMKKNERIMTLSISLFELSRIDLTSLVLGVCVLFENYNSYLPRKMKEETFRKKLLEELAFIQSEFKGVEKELGVKVLIESLILENLTNTIKLYSEKGIKERQALFDESKEYWDKITEGYEPNEKCSEEQSEEHQRAYH